jgi:pilus assembly protein CpaC
MKKGLLIIFLLVLNLIAIPLLDYALDETGEELKLFMGEIKIVPVNNPSRIVITNPNIADVTDVTKDEITLIPKAPGATNLVFWDNFGEQSYQVRVLPENMNEIKRRIDNLLGKLNLPDVYTQIAEEEGKILLLGRVKRPQDRERISTALGSLKDKITDLVLLKEEEAVVNIDVQVLELNKDATNTLGLTNPLSTTSGITLTEVGSPGIASVGTKWSTLFKVLNLKRDAFTWTLYALVQDGKARVLSRPRLSCQSGKEAELLVGGEKPIFTTTVAATTGTSGTNVDYKQFGIKLKIKPTVTEEKRIKLALNVEVSEVGTAEFIGLTTQRTAQAYPLTKRNASTELILSNGETMAIGGLMKQKNEEDITKTPWFGDVPVLGMFFRKKVSKTGGGTGERGNVELFITLTPTVVSEEKKASKDTKEIRPEITPSAISNISGNPPESIIGYAKMIQKRILENLTYPPLAREAGFQGTVKLGLHLSYRGELLEAKVKQSSGYKIFDDQAINVAKGIVSYPPFPSSIKQKELWIDVPITYQLD